MGIVDAIIENMRAKSSNELIDIYVKNDHLEWSDAAFEAMRQVLAERGVPLPKQAAVVTAYGRFRKVRVEWMPELGHYRGQGFIEIREDNLRVSGRHIRSLGWRWGVGLAAFLAAWAVDPTGFAPGFLPGPINIVLSMGVIGLMIYYIVEHVWLKSEDIVVPVSQIISYAADPNRHLIAIDFHAYRWCRPVVLRTRNWQDVLAILHQEVPERDASAKEGSSHDECDHPKPSSNGAGVV
jgi:hypothetical protein